jgi:sulfatase modifying factor 1
VRRFAALVSLTACASSVPAVPPVAVIPAAPAPVPSPPVVYVPRLVPPAPTAPVPPAVPPLADNGCPADMVAVGAVCVDRYEAPNEKGELPYALQTAYDGEAWCAERGKRLCSEDEWVRACTGPHGRPFPYGSTYKEGACNDDKGWLLVRWKMLGRWPQDDALDESAHLYQADMSGARAECVSEDGVYDLTGNVAEWVRRSKPSNKPGFDHVLKGCFWSGCFKDPRPSCAFTNAAHPGTFRTYEAGFRCCKARATGVTSRP